MCPACIQSALLLVAGAGSAGGLALIAARAFGVTRATLRPKNSETSDSRAEQDMQPEENEWGAITTGGQAHATGCRAST
jgi:hypothetical protein